MMTDEQIREVAQDAILGLIEQSTEAGIVGWLDRRYDWLSREDVNRVAEAVHDAETKVSWK